MNEQMMKKSIIQISIENYTKIKKSEEKTIIPTWKGRIRLKTKEKERKN